ncbi:MAG: hypothetical protein HS113_04135 [Verrucomicrobiales bacterium]|nr:hypothetical protein [Verrucomicrobiales bacterium]
MNRVLTWFNLLGVLVLAVLCVVQWRANRQLNLDLIQVERHRLEQTAAAERLAETTAGQASDLADLRGHLARAAQEGRDARDQLALLERELDQSRAETDQIKSALTNWAAAVAARDDRLQQAAEQLRAAIQERNDTVTRFNELAGRYNRLVQDFDALQERLASALTNTSRPPSQR